VPRYRAAKHPYGRHNVRVPRLTPHDAGEVLRGRGMRSTPQRRAILSVFTGGRTEHLAADEVYAQASRLLPDLSRATVYATLAEFSELGLLSAFGTPEPVRYETNLEPHAHFRCHLCLRVFDLAGGQQNPADITDPGFVVERVETRAEGICDECSDYDTGLRAGARAIRRTGPLTDTLSVTGAAVSEIETPLGKLLLAATPEGLTRVAFDDHGDVDALRVHASRRRGSQTARRHLAAASSSLQRYFSGELSRPACSIDWGPLGPTAATLITTQSIPYASHRSYSDLGQNLSPRDLGHLIGCNPIPVFMPCHRVGRGTETPTSFVGGAVRRTWLETHEQTHPLA
jgi:Fe2+ or Zn2+ uptake regulation protein/O6-methylguanine-DNA--protein-cysteine methyltransferase